jgi:hypothetical protein
MDGNANSAALEAISKFIISSFGAVEDSIAKRI